MIAIPNITSSSDSTSICSLSCKTIYIMLADQSRNMILRGGLLERKTGKLPKHLHKRFLACEKGGKWSTRSLVLALLAGRKTRAFCSAYKRACVQYRKLLRARENSSDENAVGFGFAFDYLRICRLLSILD